MEGLLTYLPIILYLLGSVLLIILIILGVKLIYTINKMNVILDDAYNKANSLNTFFNAIDSITDMISTVSDSVVASVTNIIGKIFHKNKKRKKEID